MSEVCGKIGICGYFKKYSETGKASHQSYIKSYCCGPRHGACEREVYRKAFDAVPPDELMPSGALVG